MASDKTLKIPCIESTGNLKILIQQELPSLFPTALETTIRLGRSCASENPQNSSAAIWEPNYVQNLDCLFIQAFSWPASQHYPTSLPWSIKEN